MEKIKIRDNPHQHRNTTLDDHRLPKLEVHPSPKVAPPSPPSNVSSPTHEFSFTVSLHPNSAATTAAPDKSKAAVDFSPADEIFFQGHLLPLHLLSHLPPISPRTSTNSLDSLTLPVKDLIKDQTKTDATASNSSDIKEKTKSKSFSYGHPHRNVPESKDRSTKSKSFSFLGIPRWRREKEQIIMMGEKRPQQQQHQQKQKLQNNNQQNQKRSLKFDIGNVVKRYIRMMRPIILSLRGRKEKSQLLRQPYSFSGNLVGGGSRKGGGPGRRDVSSAPASMRTSPGNSGLLVPVPTSTSDSTMEELQAAIQAAIAHCKNSISMEDKIKAK